MNKFVGIDLGTTFSVIAILDDLGRPEIITIDSERITPSVVYFDEDDPKTIVGKYAKLKLTDPYVSDRVVQEVKREMGNNNKKYKIDNDEYSPVEISSFILRRLIQAASKDSEDKGKITEAVITVPANFSEKERKATMDAGKLAGIEVNHIVNEPTAAAIFYASLNPISGNVLIYDLGGGTFDVTVARITNNDVQIIASAGDKHLGGKDFDQKILEIMDIRYKNEFGVSAINEKNRQELVEACKHGLSNRETIKVGFEGNAGYLRMEITRTEFEEAISSYIAKTELLIDSVLDEANLTPLDINEILLVGGSTRIPVITKSLKRLFNKDPLKAVNPDEAVSLGAAIYAGLKADKSKLTSAQATVINKMKLSEVCNDYYGTLAMGFDEASEKTEYSNFIILEKNTTLPCSNTHQFQTIHDGQTAIKCAVTQSKTEEKDPQFVQTIWQGRLEGLPPDRPAGQPVDVTFSYDTNQRMHCRYKDVNSGKELEVDLHPGDEEILETQKIHLEQILIE